MSDIPNLGPGCRSWIIVDRQQERPVLETFSRDVASAVNRDRYEVLTALQWLQRFRTRVSDEHRNGEDRASGLSRAAMPARPDAGGGRPSYSIPENTP